MIQRFRLFALVIGAIFVVYLGAMLAFSLGSFIRP